MSELQKELNNRIFKCIKRETGLDLSNPKVSSNLSLDDHALIQEYGFKCALKVIRRLAKPKFTKWIGEEYSKIENDAEEVGKRMIRFGSKVGDPVDVLNQVALLSDIIENLVEYVDGEEILADHSAVVRLLLISYIGELQTRISINSQQPLFFTIGLAKLALGKENSWSTSMLALTIEEQFIKKKATELGIELKDDEKYYSILKKLSDYMDENNIRQSRELLLADSHRKIRNRVLHENWNPNDDEMDDIIAHVLKIVQFFSSEDFQ